MQKIEMVDLPGQYRKIEAEIDAVVKKVITSAAFINGPEVAAFRRSLESYLGAAHAVTCGNGTDALQIAMMALDLQPGDEVITTPFTFVATVEAIALLGLVPVFVDACPRCFNIDTSKIEGAITKKTRVIMPVHLFGQCANMDRIMEIAGKHGLWVIEDAAQALGSRYTFENGETRMAATIGHIGCTSFFPSKNLGCFGDGGAMITGDERLAGRMRSITFHGSDIKYYHDRIGVNSRLDTLQAAILGVKIRYLDRYNSSRAEAAAYYDSALEGVNGLVLPGRMKQSSHIYNTYTLRTEASRRDGIREFLKQRGVPTMVYYPVPMHLQKAYTGYGYRKGDFPVAEELSQTVFSIPMHTELDRDQLEYISNSVRDYFTSN